MLVNSRGFTILELIISIAIVVLIMSVGSISFFSTKNKARLDAGVDGMISKMSQARSDALAGKSGTDYGIKFGTSSYTYFSGSTYSVGNNTNILTQLGNNYRIGGTVGTSSGLIIFYRLTGLPSATGTVTVTDTSTSLFETVTIGTQGDLLLQR